LQLLLFICICFNSGSISRVQCNLLFFLIFNRLKKHSKFCIRVSVYHIYTSQYKVGIFIWIFLIKYFILTTAPIPLSLKPGEKRISKGASSQVENDEKQLQVFFDKRSLCDNTMGDPVKWYIIVAKNYQGKSGAKFYFLLFSLFLFEYFYWHSWSTWNTTALPLW
jgi:hypothetical protein